jgi:hypothetical protein
VDVVLDSLKRNKKRVADLLVAFPLAEQLYNLPFPLCYIVSAEEFAPMISADKKYLFFTSSKAGARDIYWVLADVIQNLKPKKQRSRS